MKLLWFSWKDITHPQAGGAELVTHELLKRAVADGHEAVLITSRPPGRAAESVIDGYRVHRAGNRWTVYWHARKCYLSRFRDWPDIVIDECNTIPFFAKFYARQPVAMYFQQLCREIWFYQMHWPLSWIGYAAEPIYLRWLNKAKVITISHSTSKDLQRFGFNPENIDIIGMGIQLTPIGDLSSSKQCLDPTVLCLGAIRPMKRTLDIVRAFETAKQRLPSLRLSIAGSDQGEYAARVRTACRKSPYRNSIEWVGPVSEIRKIELLRGAHIVAVASVKEGWCLVVTEANSQGTPAVAYDVDGLRDSVRHEQTGWLCEANPSAMADAIVKSVGPDYEKIRESAWRWSREFNFRRTYDEFVRCITL